MVKQYGCVSEVPFLQKAASETLEQLEAAGKVQEVKKGTVVLRPGLKQSKICILMAGNAFIYTLTREGGRKIIFILGPGSLINESVLTPEKTNVYCEMLNQGKIYSVEQSAFLNLMEKDFSLVTTVLHEQEMKLRRTCHQLKNTLGSIYQERKLAAKLWKLARDFGVPEGPDSDEVRIDLELSITFLADMMGTPRETTSRICKKLVERDLIRMERRSIIIRSMESVSKFYMNKE